MQVVTQGHIEGQLKRDTQDFFGPMDDEIDNPQFLWGKGPENFPKIRQLQFILQHEGFFNLVRIQEIPCSFLKTQASPHDNQFLAIFIASLNNIIVIDLLDY